MSDPEWRIRIFISAHPSNGIAIGKSHSGPLTNAFTYETLTRLEAQQPLVQTTAEDLPVEIDEIVSVGQNEVGEEQDGAVEDKVEHRELFKTGFL